jgi:hypothetical protein
MARSREPVKRGIATNLNIKYAGITRDQGNFMEIAAERTGEIAS